QPIFVEWRNRPPQHVQDHPGSTVWIRAARHPLLAAVEVIPTDFLVADDLFTVLITGPNTGGKTVALKNIGLMVLMAQSGLHLPAVEARLTVFDKIFADIGDEQSIEQSLSTFSAHITNIIHILDTVDDRSLVVLDELGSGTDPTEGAAIAQAIINYLRDKGATSFIATHYPELKIYASQTAGATNASMMFDLETLSPTYELAIGIPGKSNALAIARRLGLNETVLDEAMGLVGVGSQQAESLIDSIFDLREKISAEAAATRLALKKAEQERDSLVIESAGIEYERRRIIEAARREGERELAVIRAEIRKARRTLRDAQSLTKVKKISKAVGEMEARLEQEVDSAEIQVSVPKRRRNRRLRVGDNVLIRALNQKGTILSLRGKDAEISAGSLRMRVQLDQLEFRGRDEPETHAAALPRAPIVSDMPLELDLRGERIDSGLDRLDQYLDAASLAELPFARIIHGKGTGRLRDAVRRALKEHAAVKKWEEAKDNEGGSGVTIVRFK
ncbi:MAG TPA: endonuclease MutS2, partial [Hellea balneolensis]|nr:endonuclease MutS2 [Hellea balneolensis]